MDSNYILTNILNISGIWMAMVVADVLPILSFVTILFAIGWNIVKLVNWLNDDKDGYGKFKRNLTKKKK